MLGAGVPEVSLLGEWCIKLILPKITSLCRAQERINVLVASGCGARPELRIANRVIHLAEVAGGRLREHVGVVAWSRLLLIFDLRVFAVGNFRAEDAGISLRTEILLLFCSLRLIIDAGAWVLSRWELLVLDVDRGLEELSNLL